LTRVGLGPLDSDRARPLARVLPPGPSTHTPHTHATRAVECKAHSTARLAPRSATLGAREAHRSAAPECSPFWFRFGHNPRKMCNSSVFRKTCPRKFPGNFTILSVQNLTFQNLSCRYLPDCSALIMLLFFPRIKLRDVLPQLAQLPFMLLHLPLQPRAQCIV